MCPTLVDKMTAPVYQPYPVHARIYPARDSRHAAGALDWLAKAGRLRAEVSYALCASARAPPRPNANAVCNPHCEVRDLCCGFKRL